MHVDALYRSKIFARMYSPSPCWSRAAEGRWFMNPCCRTLAYRLQSLSFFLACSSGYAVFSAVSPDNRSESHATPCIRCNVSQEREPFLVDLRHRISAQLNWLEPALPCRSRFTPRRSWFTAPLSCGHVLLRGLTCSRPRSEAEQHPRLLLRALTRG